MSNVLLTQSKFEEEVFQLTGNEYVVIGQYKNAITKITFKHKKCGLIFKKTPSSFKDKRRKIKCPDCALKARGRNRRKTYDGFVKEVFGLVGDEYSVLGKYTLADEYIRMKHNTCGNEYQVTPSDFLNSRRCPECAWAVRAKNRTKTTEEFEAEVKKVVGNEFSVIGDWDGAHSRIEFKHKECGHEFSVHPHNFLTGKSRCPRCNSSKGENRIADFLEKSNMPFTSQFRIKDCKNKRPLPFDFAIFEEGTLKMLIEYDGELHFKPKLGEEQFRRQKKHDEIKTSYCKKNSIKLLRIPYTEINNIEEILTKNIT